MFKWYCVEPGWWLLEDDNRCHVGVCRELIDNEYVWCVYLDEDMPPGDSQHRTLREAKAEAERLVKR